MPLAPLSRLPSAALAILREGTRLLLHRPVFGVVAAARVPDGRWVLIRRADTGTWALPGGTLEWSERVSEALPRELLEEAGVRLSRVVRAVGVYSRPDRDPRFHAVTLALLCDVELPSQPPANPLEILEVRLFADDELPELAMGTGDMLEDARRGGNVVVE